MTKGRKERPNVTKRTSSINQRIQKEVGEGLSRVLRVSEPSVVWTLWSSEFTPESSNPPGTVLSPPQDEE